MFYEEVPLRAISAANTKAAVFQQSTGLDGGQEGIASENEC